jgi:hypothetical protein
VNLLSKAPAPQAGRRKSGLPAALRLRVKPNRPAGPVSTQEQTFLIGPVREAPESGPRLKSKITRA